MNKISTIITGGGTSSRFGENKLLYKIADKEIILHTISKFEKISDEIVVPTSKEVYEVISKYYPKVKLAPPGYCRQKSVLNALNKLEFKDIVLIHDGARPYIDEETILKTIETVKKYDMAIVCCKAIDTIKICDKNKNIISTPNRQTLYHAQTPQGFKYNLIYEAHKKFEDRLDEFTDDSSLLEAMGYKPKIVEGNISNKKITTKFDV